MIVTMPPKSNKGKGKVTTRSILDASTIIDRNKTDDQFLTESQASRGPTIHDEDRIQEIDNDDENRLVLPSEEVGGLKTLRIDSNNILSDNGDQGNIGA